MLLLKRDLGRWHNLRIGYIFCETHSITETLLFSFLTLHPYTILSNSPWQCNIKLNMCKDCFRQIDTHLLECLYMGFVLEYSKRTGSWMRQSWKGMWTSDALKVILGMSTRLPAWLPPRKSFNGSLEKCFRGELSFYREGTCRRQ